MTIINRRAGTEPALRWYSALLNGNGLAVVLFGNLMVPVFGSDALAEDGVPVWQRVALTAIVVLAVATAALVLAKTGWKPSWRWVAGGMAVAAAGLLGPLLIDTASWAFFPGAAVSLAVFGFAAGFAQFAEQTVAVARVEEGRRSQAVGAIMRWHLVAGVVLGGVPFFFGWRVGEMVLAASCVLHAVGVAVQRRESEPQVGEEVQLRRLLREAGAGTAVVATGQAAWTAMYLLPGVHTMSDGWIAVYAVVAQVFAWVGLAPVVRVTDKNRRLVATISGAALLIAILGVAIFPAGSTGVGIWVGLACFAAGELAANAFISAIEGEISLEIGGQRAQLVGYMTKFGAVGAAGVLIAILAQLLNATDLGKTASAIALGVTIVVALGAILGASLRALRARQSGTVAGVSPGWWAPFARLFGATALGRALLELGRIDAAARRTFELERRAEAELPGPTDMRTGIKPGGKLRWVYPTKRELLRRRSAAGILVFVELAGQLFVLERVKPGYGTVKFAVWCRGKRDASYRFNDLEAATAELRRLLKPRRKSTRKKVKRELAALPSIVAGLYGRPGRALRRKLDFDVRDMLPVYECWDGWALARWSSRRATEIALPLPDGKNALVVQQVQTSRGSKPAPAVFDTRQAGQDVQPTKDVAKAIDDLVRPFLKPSW